MCCMKGLRRSYILLLCKGNGLTLSFCYSVADPGEGAPLIFRPNWGPKGRKKKFWRPSPAYLRVWMTAAPPPHLLSQGLDPVVVFFALGEHLTILSTASGEELEDWPFRLHKQKNKKKKKNTHTQKTQLKIMREIHTARILDNLGIWTAGWWVTTLRYVF